MVKINQNNRSIELNDKKRGKEDGFSKYHHR